MREFDVVADDRFEDVQLLRDRIEALAQLEDGWLDGGGRKPTPAALATAREVLARLLVDNVQVTRPKVYPTPDGGVQAEWADSDWMIDLRIEAAGEPLTVEASPLGEGEDKSATFTSAQVSAHDASSLGEWLQRLPA